MDEIQEYEPIRRNAKCTYTKVYSTNHQTSVKGNKVQQNHDRGK